MLQGSCKGREVPEERIREELRVMRVREVEHRRRLLVMEAKDPTGALS